VGNNFPKLGGSFESLGTSFKEAEKRPLIGITQGGSSRKGGGAKSAANDGEAKQTKKAMKWPVGRE
jgi:hypothetical protein